ncbi:MAG: MurT ligase domain-containing protein [Erysipelotrichaceae bacterium]|nr:MurT ligase domain-containing protein [Erysipelotrichaceae bacterium]
MRTITILLSKLSLYLLSFFSKGGSFPGKIALTLCPSILKKLVYHQPIILVTGTNGKTSTANMIAETCIVAGKSVAINTKGDNLKNGIATTLMKYTTLSGKIKTDMIVLEVDELTLPSIFPQLPVSSLVVTNFFRDQLDRAKEMDQLIQGIENSIQNYKGNLLLNGNDPNVMRLANKAKDAHIYTYGMCVPTNDDIQETNEGKFCPICGSFLEYTTHYYSHIGKFQCESCPFGTPSFDIAITHIQEDTFTIEDEVFTIADNAFYKMYNCLAVVLFAKVYAISYAHAKQAFSQLKNPMGRNEQFMIQQQLWAMNLIKNPTGANEVLKQIEKVQEDKIVLFALNDNAQDGTDVSWIYDSDFERILPPSTKAIICCGQRAHDAALRMKYGGYKGELIIAEELSQALQKGKTYAYPVYVLTTYTAMLPMRTLIRRESV